MKFRLRAPAVPGTLLLLLWLGSVPALMAQGGAFGDVVADDFSPLSFAGEGFHAIVLAASDDLSYQVNGPADGLERVLRHRVRILILDDSGLSQAGATVRLTVAGREEERLGDLRSQVYRLAGGKVARQKTRPVTTTTDAKGGHQKTVKITIPGVTAGHIVEYSYSLTSPFLFNHISWPVQETVPVFYREWTATLPEFLVYRVRYQGYLPRPAFREDRVNEVFTFTEQTSSRQSSSVQTYSIPFQSTSQQMEWTMRNIPPLPVEPWSGVPDAHRAALLVELTSYSLPNKSMELISGGWEGLSASLVQDIRISRPFGDLGPLRPGVEEVRRQAATDLDKLRLATALVRNRLRWNGEDGIFPEMPLPQLLQQGEANAAGMNLLLVAVLADLGVKATPVLIATRDQGRTWPGNPDLRQFNYVLALVTSDSVDYLTDAAATYYPAGILPQRCINGPGLIVGGPRRQIETGQGTWFSETAQTLLSWQGNAVADGSLTCLWSGLAAAERRHSLQSGCKAGPAFFRMEQVPVIGEASFRCADSIEQPLEATAPLECGLAFTGDTLRIMPARYLPAAAVTLPDEARQNPVDLVVPREYTCLLKMEVPPGCHLAEKPPDAVISLADQSARFTYSCSEVGGRVQIMGKLTLKSSLFLPGEYDDLRRLLLEAEGKLKAPLLFLKD